MEFLTATNPEARKKAALFAAELHESGIPCPQISKRLYKDLGYISYKSNKPLTAGAVAGLLRFAKRLENGAELKGFGRSKKVVTPTVPQTEFKQEVKSILAIASLSDAKKVEILKSMLLG